MNNIVEAGYVCPHSCCLGVDLVYLTVSTLAALDGCMTCDIPLGSIDRLSQQPQLSLRTVLVSDAVRHLNAASSFKAYNLLLLETCSVHRDLDSARINIRRPQ